MNNTPTPGSQNDFFDANMREQGWGWVWEAMLAHYWEHSLPMWRGIKSRRRPHTWVEFVLGSLLCFERFFSGCSGFPLSSKPILCFLLVLSLALRGFSLGPQVFPLLQTNSLFVVGSLPCCERFFSGSSGFPLSSKPILSKSNSICSAPSRLN